LVKVWKSWTPSNVDVFSWQLLEDMILIRQNIFRQRAFYYPSGSSCV